MTIDSIKYAIARLITKRSQLTGDDNAQFEINQKLDKLYDLKYLAIEQENMKRSLS